ncbi:MAG: hypothetical protein RQ715_05085 [Methylococcales bacterium]|nr:hypothetical protein [Methylococcales bacterium]
MMGVLGVLRALLTLVVLPVAVSAVIVWLALSDRPQVQTRWPLNPLDIERAQQVFQGRVVTPYIRTVTLSQRDLNLVLYYLSNQILPAATRLRITPASVLIDMTMTLPNRYEVCYLNISVEVGKAFGRTRLSNMRIGRLQIADELAELMFRTAVKWAHLKQHFLLFTGQILDYELAGDELHLAYKTEPGQQQMPADLLAAPLDQQRSLFYQQQLADIIERHDPEWLLSLVDLLQPLFKTALAQSSPEQAVEENRIILYTVNEYVNGHDLLPLLPPASRLPSMRVYPAYIYKRQDLARHFMASATMTVSSGEHLANLLGLEKELRDAQGDSGFSFIDLAINRAGMRFGQIAVASPASARALQQQMATAHSYQAFIPDFLDLPEQLTGRALKKQFGYVYSPPYQQMLDKIDRRIHQLPFYQALLSSHQPGAAGLSGGAK